MQTGRKREIKHANGASVLELLYRRPGFLLRRASQIAESVFVDEFESFNLTPAQCGALVIVNAHPGLDQRGIALAMGFDRATIGEILRKLEARGLIVRAASKTDARKRQVDITARGREILGKVGPALDRAQERLLAPYTGGERRLLLSLLARMGEAFNAHTRTPLVYPDVLATTDRKA